MSLLPLLVSLVLVFVMGVAIQRGNTCTVVAIDDIVHRQSWDRLLAIVYAWFWVAGGLTLVALTTGVRPTPQVVPITVWSVVGGLLLGIGAVINGACTTGSVARIGSGEYTFGLTLVGFYLGCVIAPYLFGWMAIDHVGSMPTLTSLDYPVVALIGLGVVAALTVRRLVKGPHESFREFLRQAWDPRTATFIIGLLFVALVQLFGPWAYTELLGDVSRGVGDWAVERGAFLVVMLAGAVVAGRSMKGAKLIGPLAPRVIRCFVGGTIMGIAFSIGPGAFDGLTLYGQPLLLPFAWVVMAASYVSILLGILFLRSRFGAWIKALRG